MKLSRDQPYSTTYDLYGDPGKLIEFRLFVLNECAMDCKGCFYKKTDNNYDDFASALILAKEFIKENYQLETCYLLPTDIFDNKDNYKLFDDIEFREVVGLFNYIGIATTLEDGYDRNFFTKVYDLYPEIGIEVQVNISIQKIFDISYQELIRNNIIRLKEEYRDDVVINIAINVGFKLAEHEMRMLKGMMMDLSEDGIVELNFTFLYNDKISDDKKKKMVKTSIKTVNEFGLYYEEDSSFVKKFNNRTFLNKPSFVFTNDSDIYCTPILPFDEYVFIKKDKFKLDSNTFMDFLDVYDKSSAINNVIDDICESCDNLEYCMGKHYFTIANTYELGCLVNKF